MTAPSLRRALPSDDEPVDDLPPIDGDDGDDQLDLAIEDDLADELVEDAADTDDSVADDLHVGELVEWLDDALDAADDAADLDVGETVQAFGEAGTGRADDDASGVADEDLTLGIDAVPEQGEGDAAGETVMGGGEAEVDESMFPELDSDDEADLPGELRVDDTEVADEVPLPAWAAVRWEKVSIPLVAVPMTCLWVTADRAVTAGDSAIELDFGQEQVPDARRLELAGLPSGEIVAIQGDGEDPSRLIVATHHGVHLSSDGGATVGSWTFRAPGEATIAGVTACSPRWRACYAHASDGSMFASAHPGSGWTRLEGIGSVRAVAQDAAGSLFVLALRDTPALLRFDTQGRWESEPLPGDVAPRLRGQRAWLAMDPGLALFGTPGGAIWMRTGRAGEWIARSVAPEACAAAVVDTGSGPFAVVAVYVESEDRSYLLRIEPSGEAELVGDLSPDVAIASGTDAEDSDGMGRVLAMVWDSRRGWLWVAGRFGLQAWRPGYPA